jgi:hypothetical protein
MPLVQTRGAASAQGFGEFSQPAVAANYIEDVFSTYLYEGTGATQAITNNIDLAGKGGLVWIKNRFNTGGTYTASHNLYDTVRGMNYTAAQRLLTDTTDAQVSQSNFIRADATGFSLGTSATGAMVNGTSNSYCSWTFREQAKFFDIVTYTGTAGGIKTISHNLGSTPGMLIVKSTTRSGDRWFVWHRSIPTQQLILNTTAAQDSGASVFGDGTNVIPPTSTQFTVGNNSEVNDTGETYVAYLFAHNAGGFGTSGTDNVISCGSFTTDGSGNATVSLGYEPQWVMIKKSSAAQNWNIFDSMRGMPVGSADSRLFPNSSAAEDTSDDLDINATGFTIKNNAFGASATCIYMAIRRGPMKVPTLGTSVFYPKVHAGSSSYAVGFPTDLCISGDQSGNALNSIVVYRLGGNDKYFGGTASTAAEQTVSVCRFDLQDSFALSYNSNNQARWHFRRAPGFFDTVCYTGNGSTQTIAHNLTVVPELIIAKNRTVAGNNWPVTFNFSSTTMSYAFLNQTSAGGNDTYANVGVFSASPTSTSMFLTNSGSMNASGSGIVAYLFATCAGVSKVGSYTGNGGTQAIACGFTGGARFVLIKRTDSTGDWYVYDTARGMTLLTDPYLLLNSTAAEVATLGSVTTTTGGFTVDATILAAINTNAASYIFLAIA